MASSTEGYRSPRAFTREDFEELVAKRNNWGRWGKDDQRGAMNLVDEAKRRAAVALVRTGRIVSLARPLPKLPAANNPHPADHFLQRLDHGAVDYYGVRYHGVATTHIDALCHMWDERGMWNGVDPETAFDTNGIRWGAIEHWGEGIVTRGVLCDVPRFRGVECVEQDDPVHGWELEAICAQRNVTVLPGDALVVHAGREAWERKHGRPWGSGPNLGRPGAPRDPRPGLHASCLELIRDTDCALLVWDMLDVVPSGLEPWQVVHAGLYTFGTALVDNAALEDLAAACLEEGRDEFLFLLAPLRMEGGTGSPANPIALF